MEFNLDTFGKMMDEFIEKEKIIMQVTIPENSLDAEVIDNVGAGATMQLYICLNALTSILVDIEKDFDKFGGVDMDKMLDSLLDMIKKDVLARRGDK